MAPPPIIEDYYAILCVQQDATPTQIKKSYYRLALRLHPDKKLEGSSTQAFQLLGQAYETLNDEGKRKAYDRIYPSLNPNKITPQGTQPKKPSPPPQSQKPSPPPSSEPQKPSPPPPSPPPPPPPPPPPDSAPHSQADEEAAQIAALLEAKRDRILRWNTTRSTLKSPIFELQRAIRRLEQEIESLADIEAAEKAEEARKKNWGPWMLSTIYMQGAESESEKSRKDRVRQEKRIEKDMKERRLNSMKAEMLKKEEQVEEAKEKVDAENLRDDESIDAIEAKKQSRVEQERREKEREKQREEREKEREEQERLAKIRRAQELRRKKAEKQAKLQREQQEKLRKQREAKANLRRQQEEQRAKVQRAREDLARAREAAEAAQEQCERSKQRLREECDHGGWWVEVQDRAICSQCHGAWQGNYLLQCPVCEIKACPKCQSDMKSRRR